MAANILLSLLLLFVASDLVVGCSNKLCPVVTNSNSLCKGKPEYQCVCDFTCSEWDKPCNWVLSCKAEIDNINEFRNRKSKLPVFRLPNRSHQECLDININTHKHPNCCNLFCKAKIRDVCF
ncbi:uncharacterized protein LOC128263192 [Drosophila gunungcola]|uniref:Uncharacterized protein n=1 Tax=Drosophila gunungcola TaxID=103775 RepID=A0A9P9YSS3_9MUSC|nr:uncharacterized protein LOC128263192 [Drosophila gunungcola]KAI8042098.1 hypothetical protein M5D96_003400 [Drosophila gunungcola]